MREGIKAGLIVSLLPLIFSILVVITWTAARQLKGSRCAAHYANERGNAANRWKTFRPVILTWQAVSVLLGVSLSAMALLEVSCHALPGMELANVEKLQSHLRLSGNPFPGEGLIPFPAGPTSLDPCHYLGASRPCESPVGPENSPSSSAQTPNADEPTETPAPPSGNTPSVTETPTADEPPGTSSTLPNTDPPLAETKDMTKYEVGRTYFTGAVLPTLLAILFLVPFKIIYLHVASLDPFCWIARPGGASGYDSILTSHLGLRSMLMPVLGAFSRRFVVLVAAVLQWLAALTAPLAAESIGIVLVGSCGREDSSGCLPVVAVSKAATRALVVVMALVSLLAGMLLWLLRSWDTGVTADPRSIVGIAGLCLDQDVRNELHATPTNGIYIRGAISDKVGVKHFALGPVDRGVGITLTEPGPLPRTGKFSSRLSRILELISMTLRPLRRWWAGHEVLQQPFFIVISALSIFGLFLSGLNVLIIWYRFTRTSTALERFINGQGFGVNFMFTLFGVIIGFVWMSMFEGEPY